MAREVFSVKIEAKLKENFTRVIREKGLSTCFVIETLLTAWLEGSKAAPAPIVDPSKTITVIQNFQRVVKRGRRLFEDLRPENNCYKPTVGWFYQGDEPINEHGHVIQCECSICRKKGKI